MRGETAETASTGRGGRRGALLLLAGIAVLGGGIYLQAAGGPVLAGERPALEYLQGATPGDALAFQQAPDQATPLANLIRYALLRTTGSTASLRVASALLHGLNAALVFLLASSLLARLRPAAGEGRTVLIPAAAALLFAVHPLASEAVLSHSALGLVAGATLSLGSLLMAAARRGAGEGRGFGSAALYLAALLCHAIYWPVGLVAAALAADPATRPGGAPTPVGIWARRLLPYATALALFYIAWAARTWPQLSFAPAQRAWPLVQGLASQGAALVDALRLLVFPVGLSLDQGRAVYLGDWNFQAVAGLGLMLVLLTAAWLGARRPGLAGTALAWLGFLQLHLLIAPPDSPLEERRLYPLILAAALLGARAVMEVERRAAAAPAAAVAAALCVPLAMSAAGRARLWMEPVELWKAATRANPTSSRGYVALGNLHLERGETEEALQAYEGALARTPQSAPIQNSLAEVYFTRGDYFRALQEANKAMELDPSYVSAYLTAGNSFMMRGQTRDAFLAFNAALLVNPDHPAALHNMGVLHFQQKQYVKAARLLEKATQLRPGDAETWFRLGLSRFFQGDYAGAGEALRTCLELDPERIDAKVNLASVLTKLGRHEEAGVILRAVLEEDPGSADAMNGMAILASARNDPEAARSWFEQAVEADPDNLQYLFNLGGIYEELGQTEKAIEAYQDFVDRWTGSLDLAESVRERLDSLQARLERSRQAG